MYGSMYLPMNWRKSPEIKVDHTKCTVPMYCKQCLQACPQACFKVDEAEFQRFVEQDREKARKDLDDSVKELMSQVTEEFGLDWSDLVDGWGKV